MHKEQTFLSIVKKTLFSPSKTFKELFDDEKLASWRIKESLSSFGLIIAEIFSLIACLQYWWFGQLYMKSTLILFGALLLLVLIPTIGFKKHAFAASLYLKSILLLFPAIAASIIIIIFRMGLIDYIDRYLYRSPLLVSLFLVFALFSISWKCWCRVIVIGTRKPAIKIGYSVSLTFLDLILATIFILLLLNFEGLLALL